MLDAYVKFWLCLTRKIFGFVILSIFKWSYDTFMEKTGIEEIKTMVSNIVNDAIQLHTHTRVPINPSVISIALARAPKSQ